MDATKGLYKSEPQPKPKAPPPDAKQIPEFTKEKQPRYVTRPRRCSKTTRLRRRTPFPTDRAARQRCPTRNSRMGAGGATNAGMGFSGPGGGDFGGRFSWYVDAVRNRVSSNWLQSTVDPSLRFAPRAVVTLDILRNGAVANVQILQSSGNASVDNSAVRAILGSNPVNALPNEYSGQQSVGGILV